MICYSKSIFLITDDVEDSSLQIDAGGWSEFPMLPDCQQKNIDLVLVSDASSPDYSSHLQLLSQTVDVFAPDHEMLGRLRVAMAVYGSDSQGKTTVSWLFHLGTFSNTSEVKKAIMSDNSRNVSQISSLKKAVHVVSKTLSTNISAEGLELLKQNEGRNVSDSEECFDADDKLESCGVHNAKDENPQPVAVGRTTLIITLANPSTSHHSDIDLEPGSFQSNTKLLIVFIGHFRERDLPCSRLARTRCIHQSPQTMLQDHSLSLALCGRCSHQWFGPMPSPGVFAERANHPAAAFTSCYTLVAPDIQKTYALGAMKECTRVGGSLVSIESEMEKEYLSAELTQRCHKGKKCPSRSHLVFIGLRRNTNSLGQRFRWINGRPLIYSQWAHSLPLGGVRQGCALWDFVLNEWNDLGCGRWAFASALCEWTKVVSPEKLGITLPPPRDQGSIQRVNSRGEIGVCPLQHNNANQEPVLMATHNLVETKSCHLHVNNTGHLQIVELPLPVDKVFSCEGESLGYVHFNKVCDQIQDCANAKDESPDVCTIASHLEKDVYTCTISKMAVAAEARCDLKIDCTDKSDEQNCEACRFGLCSDGRCVPQPWLNDGEKDCVSLYGILDPDSDISINGELDCAFLCNRSECVGWEKLGDGVLDCHGPEGPLDETLGALGPADCEEHLPSEWAPKCVYQKDRLGELIGCRNMRHLHECEDFVCPEGYVKCPSAYCIPVHYLFNKAIDCPMGEDELPQQLRPDTVAGYFKCSSIKHSVFLHPDRVCDGSTDCPDGSDETGCHVTCAEGFLCVAGVVVADDYDKSEPLTDLSFVDLRTRMVDFSHINVSSVLPTMSQLELTYLLDLRLSNCSLRHVLAPRHRFYRLSKLDLTYNLFRHMSDEASNLKVIFSGVRSLQILNLSHNALLETFDTKALVSCVNLRTLDLAYTALTAFPKMEAISTKLMHLNLSHTRIMRLAAFTFHGGRKFWHLVSLDLRGVHVKEVEPGAFRGLKVMEEMHSAYFKLCCPQIRGEGIPAHTCHAPNDPLSSCFNLLENRLLRILVWVMGVASLLGNLGVIVTRLASRRTTMRLPYAQLVAQLSVSDFLMGVYLIIIGSKDVQFEGEYVWHDTTWPHSSLCRAAGFLSTLSSEVSSCFILLITVDRYLVIKYPFGQHRLSPTGVLTCSIVAWSVGLTLAAVPLLPWTAHWNLYSSNSVCLGLPLLPERRSGWQFSTAVFIAFNFLLCVCIAVGQVAIYSTASSNRSAAPVLTSDLNSFSWGGELTPRMKQDVALARRLAAVAFTDLLCWVPIGVLGLLALGGHSLGGEAYAWMAVFVLPVNSALNPVLYSLPVIRDHVVKALVRCILSTKKRMSKAGHDAISSRI
ncbi:hypothetical protein RRG08_050442 [Elysia crispata]|uniref:G-protein coupled receptors family 1 profile domain-containing protein n=1 Tax=Elysia crispata TaxID=231223 RepID=A0AAE1DI31_9GAST|nr:hypothetical protein RRG08_050442 [Elysia crispata]